MFRSGKPPFRRARFARDGARYHGPVTPTKASNPAGYSGTPLPKKLGIKPACRVLLLDAPDGFAHDSLGELPPEVDVRTTLRSSAPFDVMVCFLMSRTQLDSRLPRVTTRMTPACGLWLAWPKKASGITTDLTEDVLRDVVLPTGLVDNKVCAIDQTWSGLRFVIRKENR